MGFFTCRGVLFVIHFSPNNAWVCVEAHKQVISDDVGLMRRFTSFSILVLATTDGPDIVVVMNG